MPTPAPMCLVKALRATDLMLLHGSSHISSIDSPVVQVCEPLDVGQHIAAVVRGGSNGVAGQVDQPQLLELPQVHDIIKGGDVVATCSIVWVAMAGSSDDRQYLAEYASCER